MFHSPNFLYPFPWSDQFKFQIIYIAHINYNTNPFGLLISSFSGLGYLESLKLRVEAERKSLYRQCNE
jgi:hypothetical protein